MSPDSSLTAHSSHHHSEALLSTLVSVNVLPHTQTLDHPSPISCLLCMNTVLHDYSAKTLFSPSSKQHILLKVGVHFDPLCSSWMVTFSVL